MDKLLKDLIRRLDTPFLDAIRIIPWGCPIPAFGVLGASVIATLGLNPSKREFVDGDGVELDGPLRRLHTLKSLGLAGWSAATVAHLQCIDVACRDYFARNPYDAWFRSLDCILSGAGCTYYGERANACHLDLIPYATLCKWTELTVGQRSALLAFAGDALGHILRNAPVRILLLNGKTVVENLQCMTGVEFDRAEMGDWTLPRHTGGGVTGCAFRGTITRVAGVDLRRSVTVFGYNHNIQSSFGVTARVKAAIRDWFSAVVKEVPRWDPQTVRTGNASATSSVTSMRDITPFPASCRPATATHM
jgi:hypothetical protein